MFAGSSNDQYGNAGSEGVNGPPPADAMFESFLNDGLDELADGTDGEAPGREGEVLTAGLHFFERMKAMR